jgi:hypothetical protein
MKLIAKIKLPAKIGSGCFSRDEKHPDPALSTVIKRFSAACG